MTTIYQKIGFGKRESIYVNKGYAIGIIKKIKKQAKKDVLGSMNIRKLKI